MKMTSTILQVIKIDPLLIEEIKPSFDDLPETDHTDGKYRLRKYSKVKASQNKFGTTTISSISKNEFIQSEKYNKHQGGMNRKFINIDENVIHSPAIKELITAYWDACLFSEIQEIDIHQMRVKCIGGATQLSPEGWHQDGYDCIAMIGIDRHNIIGGEVLLSTSKTEKPFLKAVMDSGTMVIVDDSYLWHNGRSIQPIDDTQSAYMDVMVFTARRSS
jgi:hypothetical protein